MEIQQKLKEVKKEAADNEKNLFHYRDSHEALKLEDIEYVSSAHAAKSLALIVLSDSDDDEEEEDAAAENTVTEAATDADGDEAHVKPEETDNMEPPPDKQTRTSSKKLQVYTVDELSRFKKKELLADVTLLEG